ncbi:MAG: hypothetical protein C0600_05990 [Ignavibacteria bacterium]|nr:MAG: hypothetical protein C0600_05990 [Ignavibacteria bacterium]
MNARDDMMKKLSLGSRMSADQRIADLQHLHDRLRDLSGGDLAELIPLFRERLLANGAEVAECRDGSEIAEALESILGDDDRIVLADDARFADHDIARKLSEKRETRRVCLSDDGNLAPENGGWKQHYAGMDAGITFAVGGVAESGAVIVHASPGESRSMSLLPMHHIALVSAEHLHATLLDAAPLIASLSQRNGSSAVTLIGGPSKTADIEKVLVTGMHGPKRFTVLIVHQLPAGQQDSSTPLSHHTEG